MAYVSLVGSGTASASSIYNATYAASKAFDGNTSTRWNAADSGAQWLQYDFGATPTLDVCRVSVRDYSTRTGGCIIYGSDNGVDWTQMSDSFDPQDVVGGTVVDLYNCAPYRYIRMTCTSGSSAAILEMDIYGDDSPPPVEAIRLSFEQLYHLMTEPVRLSFYQDYALLHYLRKDFQGLYGIRFGASFVAWYGDLPTVRRRFLAAYRSLPSVRRSRVLSYRDAAVLRLAFVQEYLLRAGVLKGFCARYRIAEEELRAAHEAAYRISEYDQVRLAARLPYVLAADVSLQEGSCSFYLPEIDLQLHPYQWEVDQDGGQHYISVELQLPDQAEAVQCRKHLRLVSTVDGEVFETVISKPVRRTVAPGATSYVVEAQSPSIYLDVGPTSHYSRPVSGSYSGMASSIVAGLAAGKGLTVDWRIRDWYIPPGRLEVSEFSPLAVIREVVHAKRARLQSAADGNLRVIYDITKPVAQWRTSSPALVVIDQEHWRQAVETPEERPGYNRLSLSDMAGGAARVWFEERKLSASRLYQHLFCVPWVGGEQPVLQTSSVGVSMEPLGMIEEVVEREEIAIENGSGKASKPVYGIVSAEWADVDLGDIAYTEEGELTTAVAEQSLLYLSYRTRYWRWLVTNHRTERVQFYVEAAA